MEKLYFVSWFLGTFMLTVFFLYIQYILFRKLIILHVNYMINPLIKPYSYYSFYYNTFSITPTYLMNQKKRWLIYYCTSNLIYCCDVRKQLVRHLFVKVYLLLARLPWFLHFKNIHASTKSLNSLKIMF